MIIFVRLICNCVLNVYWFYVPFQNVSLIVLRMTWARDRSGESSLSCGRQSRFAGLLFLKPYSKEPWFSLLILGVWRRNSRLFSRLRDRASDPGILSYEVNSLATRLPRPCSVNSFVLITWPGVRAGSLWPFLRVQFLSLPRTTCIYWKQPQQTFTFNRVPPLSTRLSSVCPCLYLWHWYHVTYM